MKHSTMRNLLIISLICISIASNAQVKSGGTYKEYFQEGSYLLLEDNYLMAKDNFEAAYQIDSSNANINYLLGICYLKSLNEKYKAEYHLSNAIKNITKNYKNDQYTEKAAPPLAHYYYGEALNINYKFDEAIAQYNEFKKYAGTDKVYNKKLTKAIATSEFAKAQYASPLNVQITNMGDSINGQYPDFSPVMSADEHMLIYTTRRPSTTGGMKDVFGYYHEDVVVSYKDFNGVWSSPKSLSENINSGNMEASVNITADGQTLIIYKDDGTGTGGNIYYSTFDGKDWSTLKEFGSDVNTKYWESHACLNKDQTVLYFSSNRPGGYGGKDIYRCVKLPNGKWSKAYNMGPTINTDSDEDGAFIHPDGVTFFFASNGHKTMGGYDIMFTSISEENTFGEITNIGYPINTTDDDVFYISSVDGKRGYFSSAKDGGYGEKDIYMVSIPEAKEKPLALFKGQIIPAPGETLPEDILIVVKDKETGEIVGTYKPRIVNGVFSTILPPGREYNFSYQAPQGEEFYNEDVYVTNELTYNEIKREVNLEPVKLLGKISTKKKSLILNTIVLNNAKQKLPVSDANISVQESNGAVQSLKSDANGKYDNFVLEADKKYTVFAEKDGKKSAIASISTMGVKGPKVFSQVLYIDGKAAPAEKEQLLNVLVKDKKTGKAIPYASVVIEDADGNKNEYQTDEKGYAKEINVALNTKYKLSATEGANASGISNFTSPSKVSKKAILKTLFIGVEQVASSNSGALPETEYEYFFKYNKNLNDDTEEQWNKFIDKIIEISSKKRSVYVRIKASASYVPTRSFKNNKQLASTRAKNLQQKIKDAVLAKGGDIKKLRFKRSSKVSGPRYKGDHDLGRSKYEPFQFVKAKVR